VTTPIHENPESADIPVAPLVDEWEWDWEDAAFELECGLENPEVCESCQ
jgi:hypothetical protein